MIIDFHTHIFPDKIAAEALTSLEGTSGFKRAIEGTAAHLLEAMEQNGVDYSVLLPVATNVRQVGRINDYALELQNQNSKLIAFAGMHPDHPGIKGELERVKALGARGVKIHSDFVGHDCDDAATVNCVRICAELELPVLLHGGCDPSFPELPRCTPHRVYRLTKAVPQATLIIAHMGGYRRYDEALLYLKDTSVYLDTSAALGWCYDKSVDRIIKEFPKDRLLFGTDSPWDTVPAALKVLRSAGLSPQELEDICCNNAKRLLNGYL
ncbi:MAG: amidohydrolase family protein [Oscillospiraceae bacterium]|jgi:predicted TIM-barrel fold metal-dependent hydrolase|nr:amidohydrolase family protein [Oscillospiraceae bacterium]